MMTIRTSAATAVLAALFAWAAPHGAHAQIIAGQGASLKPQDRKPTPAPPPALPGAATDKEMVAPATRPASEMSPNQALFDAVDRGDLESARDAMSRGADTDAKNVLGMTALDMAIDLGRKDITFMLLSMRGTGSGGTRSAQVAAKPGDAAHPTKAERVLAKKTQAKTTAIAARPPSAESPRLAKQFAGDGGAPLPSAGFLGFGEPR